MKTKTGLLILFGIVLLIVGILFYVYQTYEKPKVETVTQYANLSLAVLDEDSEQIIIDVLINLNGVDISNITTTSSGFVLIKVPVNSTVKLIVKDNKYYNSEFEYFVSQAINKRVIINMLYPGELNISSSLDKNNNQINLKVFSENEFRNPKLCTTWGLHIIWLKSLDNLEIIPTSKYDKCFSINTVNETSQTFSFNYDNYGVFTDSDFVNFYIIDEKTNIVEKSIKF